MRFHRPLPVRSISASLIAVTSLGQAPPPRFFPTSPPFARGSSSGSIHEPGSSHHNCQNTSSLSLQCGPLSSRTPALVSWVSGKMRRMTCSIQAIPPLGTVLDIRISWNISSRRSCHIELLVVFHIRYTDSTVCQDGH